MKRKRVLRTRKKFVEEEKEGSIIGLSLSGVFRN
jgi:hypothetical protein